jgi:hypothetical protein
MSYESESEFLPKRIRTQTKKVQKYSIITSKVAPQKRKANGCGKPPLFDSRWSLLLGDAILVSTPCSARLLVQNCFN